MSYANAASITLIFWIDGVRAHAVAAPMACAGALNVTRIHFTNAILLNYPTMLLRAHCVSHQQAAHLFAGIKIKVNRNFLIILHALCINVCILNGILTLLPTFLQAETRSNGVGLIICNVLVKRSSIQARYRFCHFLSAQSMLISAPCRKQSAA